MSMQEGFIVLPRALRRHPAFQDATEWAAFVDLVESAAWRPMERPWRGGFIHLERGEVPTSVRELAARWGWSRGKAERFLKRVSGAEKRDRGRDSRGTLCGTRTVTGGTVLTLCDYEQYCGRRSDDGTGRGTPAETAVGQARDTDEKRETIKQGSPSPSSGARADEREDGAAVAPVTPEAVATAREVCERLGLREGAVPAEAVAQWLGEGVTGRALVAWATAKRAHLQAAGDVVRYIGRCVQAGQVPEVSEGGGQVIPLAVSTWRNRLGALRRLGRWPVAGLSLQAMRAEVGDGPALELVREVFGPDAGFGTVEQTERGVA